MQKMIKSVNISAPGAVLAKYDVDEVSCKSILDSYHEKEVAPTFPSVFGASLEIPQKIQMLLYIVSITWVHTATTYRQTFLNLFFGFWGPQKRYFH